MNLSNAIGGYFELELSKAQDFMYNDAILLNSGRACFEYVLTADTAGKVYMPKYTCDVMLEPLKKLNVPHVFYEINEKLELKEDIRLSDGDLIVYVNYFGVKDAYSQELAARYGQQLLIDSSQAFYTTYLPDNSHIFFSPRKFFGLPDGGMLYTIKKIQESLPQDISYDRVSHLLRRIDEGPEAGYEDFRQNDAHLSDVPMSYMSNLTQNLLQNINFKHVRQIRSTNFNFLHEHLVKTNKLVIDSSETEAPMCYPYYVEHGESLREKLISNKVFVATYWPNVFAWCSPDELEYTLAKNIIPLPVDQRYDISDMKRILEVIHG